MADSSRIGALATAMREEIGKAVVGQDEAVRGLLVGLLTGGHILLEGVPGTAKTLLARSAARALDVPFKRIQFSPDMMPADVVGTNVFDTDSGTFRLSRGPIFASVVLADEINRTPPKTQAALLEAMQEGQVTIDGEPYRLPDPFLVIATQNPVEYQGTYPLPEAQLDRFLLKVMMHYPTESEEREVLTRHVGGMQTTDLDVLGLRPVASAEEVREARALLDGVTVEDAVSGYIVAIVRATREHPSLLLGASPRAAVSLLLSAKANALLEGRDYVTPDDAKRMVAPCLRHRVIVRAEVEIEGTGADAIVADVASGVPVPR